MTWLWSLTMSKRDQNEEISDSFTISNIHFSCVKLQVKTKLANPTKYYVQQSQRRQVEMYVSGNVRPQMVQSMPTTQINNSAPVSNGLMTTSGSSCPDPDSPLSVGFSSTATSVSEVRALFDLDLELTQPYCISFDLTLIYTRLFLDFVTLTNSYFHVID